MPKIDLVKWLRLLIYLNGAIMLVFVIGIMEFNTYLHMDNVDRDRELSKYENIPHSVYEDLDEMENIREKVDDAFWIASLITLLGFFPLTILSFFLKPKLTNPHFALHLAICLLYLGLLGQYFYLGWYYQLLRGTGA